MFAYLMSGRPFACLRVCNESALKETYQEHLEVCWQEIGDLSWAVGSLLFLVNRWLIVRMGGSSVG